jgi:hypothetical protein
MIRFELGVAITLAVSAFGSLVLFYLAREKVGKVRLPVHVDESEDVIHRHDPFDVTTLEDITDGYPIDADAFWASVRCIEMAGSANIVSIDRCDEENLLSCSYLSPCWLSTMSF